MLNDLFLSLSENYSFLNVFSYITFRTGIAIFTSLLFVLYFGKPFISYLKSSPYFDQPIRYDGPISHIVKKKGTPTFGGILIIIAIIVSTFLWSDIENIFVLISIFSVLSFALIGFFDDFLKIKRKDSKGINAYLKLLFQIIFSVMIFYLISISINADQRYLLSIPFYKNLIFDIGYFYLPFAIIVIVGSSNAVNLTDGLDGLATVPVILVTLTFILITYLVGNAIFSDYLKLINIKNISEVCIVLGATVGACLGFLWYNAPPAKIFMGDTGSLALGGLLGTVSLITKHEIALFIAGGLFVLEALSVIIQVFSFKFFGKRVFKMAPLHHHFEKKGWAESTIVIRFWIISIILVLIALSTLKLR
ncbi:MAG: phospho-N-acetylmuramoyl-pentapeptide-transferase [Candidatus Pelagibacter sp.]|nr:phospho-N-acetylmuramoyl-pentapeptide-transferase [Candidatus Pelagibacter sp.]OUV98025.1 MAG: phospho-N-acetylmuramoyl-pentapeptide-transferase [Candidatus Pelagibacter sp. TMED142]|tara:strand:- start:252 stop:1340 length:1089 start_codon:yes stop_codon:yes gene_type:complete